MGVTVSIVFHIATIKVIIPIFLLQIIDNVPPEPPRNPKKESEALP